MPIVEYVIGNKTIRVMLPDVKTQKGNTDGEEYPEGYEPFTAFFVKHTDKNIRCMVKCRYCVNRMQKNSFYRCKFAPTKVIRSYDWKFCDHFVLSEIYKKKIMKENEGKAIKLPFNGGWLDKAMVAKV